MTRRKPGIGECSWPGCHRAVCLRHLRRRFCHAHWLTLSADLPYVDEAVARAIASDDILNAKVAREAGEAGHGAALAEVLNLGLTLQEPKP